MTNRKDLLRQVGEYYSGRIREHGATARGVDWNGEQSQSLRFDQLLRVAEGVTRFTLGEVGCGYGALVDHLAAANEVTAYHGVDLSPEMIAAATERHGDVSWAQFSRGSRIDRQVDYCVASGVFNVRLNMAEDDWLPYIRETLDAMNSVARRGFAFNALTSFSDPEKMRDYLYYADPGAMFDHCKRHYSRNIALLHDYGLYEFTILVRKDVA